MQAHLGVSWLFGASAIFGIAAFVIALGLRYESSRSTGKLSSASPADALHLDGRASARRVFRVCLIFGAVTAPYGAVMGYVAAYGFEVGVMDVGLYFTAFAVAVFGTRILLGGLPGKLGVTTILIPGLIAMSCGMATLFWADRLSIFLASAVLVGVGFGVALPLLQTTMISFAPAAQRGTASAAFFATADIGYAVGALLMGVAASKLGYPSAFALLGAFALLAIILHTVSLAPILKKIH